MTFDELGIPEVSSGFGVWKQVEPVVNGDWAAAEDALCQAALPVIEDKGGILSGYKSSRSERLNKLSLYLLR